MDSEEAFFSQEYADELDLIQEHDDDIYAEMYQQSIQLKQVKVDLKSKRFLNFENQKQLTENNSNDNGYSMHISNDGSDGENSLIIDESRDDNVSLKEIFVKNKSCNTKKRTNDCSIEELKENINTIGEKKKKIKLDSIVNLAINNSSEGTTIHGDREVINKNQIEEIQSLKRIPNGDFLSVTSCNGDRVYLSLKNEENLNKLAMDKFKLTAKMNFLTTPLNILKAYIQEEKLSRISEESRSKNAQESLVHNDSEEIHQMPNKNEDREGLITHTLWVDKYAPSKYTDLISEEFTNRNLLRWLKLWDYTVFGKKLEKKDHSQKNKIITAKPFISNLDNKKISKPIDGSNSFNNNMQTKIDHSNELDNNNRPFYKVVLVSGPPGLGKTTLAHIIAKHAGYNVVEMNASDDRTADIFKVKIESATQMKSVLGGIVTGLSKPNCLIIDEIDGAPQPAIDMLLSIIKNSSSSQNVATTNQLPTNKSKKKNELILLRPLICICNDLYTPALRQLRQNAYLVTFHPSTTNRIANRLFEISKNEYLKTDMTALMALCDKTENDIRSCINTLQFVKSKYGELNSRSVLSLNLGQKDIQKSLMQVWIQIFSMPKQSRKIYVNPHDRSLNSNLKELEALNNVNNTLPSERFKNILQTVQSVGEDAKMQQGLFDNYLEAKSKDPRLQLLTKATDWFCFVDLLNQYTARFQDYSVMRYSPFLPLSLHFLFATNSPHRIIYPRSNYEFNSNQMRCSNLLSSLMTDIHPSIKTACSPTVLNLDILPFISEIIQPNLRPVNLQLFNSREKEELTRLVNSMTSYNLTYQQEKNLEGQYIYNLEPNIEILIKFSDFPTQRQLSYAIKQLIAREIELEKLRRCDKYSSLDNTKSSRQEVAKSNLVPVPNHLRQKLQPKIIKEIKSAVDFFGRKIQNIPSSTIENSSNLLIKDNIIKSLIWYKYKEGFTNAVRRTVKIMDFL